jgi:radical SAM protein with 4Fe4S-binding SPASM domain
MQKYRRQNMVRMMSQVAYEYLRRHRVLAHPPFRLWLEPTSHCNIACQMCPTPDFSRDMKGYMTLETFQHLIDMVAPFLNEVYLFHRGESLLHPNLAEMVAYATSKGISTKINTNATMMNEKRARALLEAGVDLVSFSVDGYSKDVYEKIRRKAKWDKVMTNARRFLELKHEGGYKTMAQMEVLEFEFEHDSPEAFDEAQKAFWAYFEPYKWDREIRRQLHNVGGNVELDEKAGYDVQRDVYLPCSYPWYALAVLWNGQVHPCPRDFMGKMPIGNIRKDHILDIWNGDRMREIRDGVVRRDFTNQEVCKTCDQPYKYTKVWMGVPWDYVPSYFKDSPWQYATRRFLQGLPVVGKLNRMAG